MKTCQVRIREISASEPLMRCRKEFRRRQNWRLSERQDKSRRQSACCLDGVRHRGGMNLVQDLFCGTWETIVPMLREKSKWRSHKDESTYAGHGDGATRISDEGS